MLMLDGGVPFVYTDDFTGFVIDGNFMLFTYVEINVGFIGTYRGQGFYLPSNIYQHISILEC